MSSGKIKAAKRELSATGTFYHFTPPQNLPSILMRGIYPYARDDNAHMLPLVKEAFGNEFRDACREAGVRKSAHGLRKVAATRAANNGATEAELEAMFGWCRGSRVSSIYTSSANRERLALGAAYKMMATENTERTLNVAPQGKVRQRRKKAE